MKKINWRYALGEIIIVMIGISLAFALNRWNEGRKENALKKLYLQGLSIDLEKEAAHLMENDSLIRVKISMISNILQQLNENENYKALSGVFEIANVVEFYPENVTYLAMVNSGDMKLIDDFELRKKIEEHYNKSHQNTQNNFERIVNINKEYLGEFFIKEIDYSLLRSGKVDFLEKPILGNILRSLQGAYKLAIKANNDCLNSNKELLEAIKAVN